MDGTKGDGRGGGSTLQFNEQENAVQASHSVFVNHILLWFQFVAVKVVTKLRNVTVFLRDVRQK